MADDYTPTTDEVRTYYAMGRTNAIINPRRAEFDRWRAAAIRQAKAEAESITTDADLHLLLQNGGQAGEAPIVHDRFGHPWILAENEHGEWWAHSYRNDDGTDILPVGHLEMPLVVRYRPGRIAAGGDQT